jgi:multidrug efflux pump subunit AcrB
MRVWAFAVRQWQFTLVLFGLLVAVGVNSYINMPRAEDPSFAYPAVTITLGYPGADPAEIERLLIDPIEEAMNELDDVKKVVSVANDGLALVLIEFNYVGDPEKKQDDVIREFNRLRPQLPADLNYIDLRRAGPARVNILQSALVSDTAPWREMEKWADELEDRLERVRGVRQSESWAYPRAEVRIAVDLDRLGRTAVTLQQLATAVQAENTSIPGGAVDAGSRRYNLKTTGSFRSLQQIEDTVVGASRGRIVHLRDVAAISWATGEHSYLGRYNGHRAVFITASQKDNQNIFKVREGINTVFDAFEKDLPQNIRLERGFDQSRNVDRRLTRLGQDFGIAIALVLITLLPLGLRAAGVVMLSIPLSLAMGLSALYFSGFSLNQLSIAGFILALGLLVDDSIVVVENISRFIRMGHSRREAAILATDQIALAVLGCTATLLFAFLPLVFLPGGSGVFVRSLPAAVMLTVIASMMVAYTIIPFLSSRMLREPGAATGGRMERFDLLADRLLHGTMHTIHRVYGPALKWALARPKRTLTVAGAVFFSSIALIPVIGVSVFPNADVPQFLIRVNADDGASLADTDRALRFIEAELGHHPEVKRWFTNVGHSQPFIYYNTFPLGTAADLGEILVELHAYDPRHSPQLLDELRTKFRSYPGARITVKQYENGPPVDAPVALRITGPELSTLRRLGGDLEALMKQQPGLRDVNNPLKLRRTDLNLGIDPAKAALLGVSAVEADRTVRVAIAGQPLGRFRESDGTEHPIVLRLPIDERPTLDLLQKIRVNTVTGQQLPLSAISSPHFETAPNVINRYNRERQVTVSAYTNTGYTTDKVTRALLKQVQHHFVLPPGYRLTVAGEVESRQEAFGGIGTAFLVAAFGIMAVLVLEFGSFRSTLIVATVVPLGVTGALLALLVTGYTLSFTGLIGLLALLGIEIKNSILLVDFTNQLRAEGKGLDEAIEQAGEIRFFPILLTSATAIGGLMPLAVQGSLLYSPLAIVIIGGLLSSTLLARLVTPAMYKLLPPEVKLRSLAP